MCRRSGFYKMNGGFTLMEVMATVAIIAILALMAMPTFIDRIVRQQIEAALPLADVAKKPIADYWAYTQTMPLDNAALALPEAEKIVNNYVEKLAVKNGVINITFGNRANGNLKGKVLSLRPAVVPDAPAVPITWVCGMAEPPGKMTVYGDNATDVATTYLPMECRAIKITRSQ